MTADDLARAGAEDPRACSRTSVLPNCYSNQGHRYFKSSLDEQLVMLLIVAERIIAFDLGKHEFPGAGLVEEKIRPLAQEAVAELLVALLTEDVTNPTAFRRMRSTEPALVPLFQYCPRAIRVE